MMTLLHEGRLWGQSALLRDYCEHVLVGPTIVHGLAGVEPTAMACPSTAVMAKRLMPLPGEYGISWTYEGTGHSTIDHAPPSKIAR
jgi:hypothetical protein